MDNYVIVDGELYHYGIPGMKWGVRRYQNKDGSLTTAGKYRRREVRGHAGPGIHISKKKRLAGAKSDLEYLDKGGHLSVGLTKKRQEKYDARDRAALEKKIAKLEKRDWSEDARTASEIKSKKVNQMSNAELKKLNERTRLEQEYSRLNPNSVQKGWKYVAAAAGIMGTTLAIYNNSNQLINAGKTVSNKIIDAAGNMVMNDLLKNGIM